MTLEFGTNLNPVNESYFEEERSPWISFLFFFLGSFFLFLSGSALLLLTELTITNDWEIYNHYFNTNKEFLIATFPFFHFIIFFVGLILSVLLFSSYNRQKNIFALFLFLLTISLALSLLLQSQEIGKNLNNYLENFSFYNHSVSSRIEMWQRAEFGLLSGEIGIINNNDTFILIGYDDNIWTIDFDRAQISKDLTLRSGEKIKLIGTKNSQNVFSAKKIKKYE